MLQCSTGMRGLAALQYLDRAFERAQLAVGHAFELLAQGGAAGDAGAELLAAFLGET